MPAFRHHPAIGVLPLLALTSACTSSDPSSEGLGQSAPASLPSLPQDPAEVCALPQATFDSWFASGSPAVNGFVNAASSVTFPTTNTDCDFYQWSSQMFLWLTSPASGSQSGLVFDSDGFFDVSPENAAGKRTLLPGSAPNNFATRLAKTDDDPVVIGELGQAGGGGVLMSQGGSLVYYGIHVNDVYGYFLTAENAKAITTNAFPTTAQELKAIEDYAGKTFADGQALTMELKTSWVDASTVDSSQFVLIEATVPKFDRTSDQKWTPNGTEMLTLAMVGMHIVGTVQGHPEMVWGTFEHATNAPMDSYKYATAAGNDKSVPFSSAGDWLFMPSGGLTTGANTEFMTVDKSGSIVASANEKIAPSPTFQANPWGSAPSGDQSPAKNAQLIALNESIRNFMPSGDVRRNYIQVGSLWTNNGKMPVQKKKGQEGNLEGSKHLANTTMETYHQDLNCFTCHDATTSIGLSHIFSDILPLGGQ